ncbi:MAG: hypothetical protein IJZ55_05175 [Lachnospiraceae bacterium]|nr:hypothetical protein [Lachnospiraceae bacterium]
MSEKRFKANPKYKDRLFCLIFGDEKEKQKIISLYNALNGTNYSEDEEVEVTTIHDVIYINMKNDVSFIVDSHMSLFEQQSSLNPNMPLRGLMYFGNLYDSYIERRGLNIYGSKLIKIPTPQYYVLYNGKDDAPAMSELKLSDAFVKESPKGMFEWTATFVNLNTGKNEELLKKCRPLADYMVLINCIRGNEAKGMRFEDAVDAAVQYCINSNVLKEFLVAHRAEVVSVCLTEFNEKMFVDSIREEGRDEGLAEGRVEGRAEGERSMVVRLVKKGHLSIEKAIEELQISKEEFISLLESAESDYDKKLKA